MLSKKLPNKANFPRYQTTIIKPKLMYKFV